VETRYLYGLMGCRGGGAGRLVFRDVLVPKENVVGEVNGAYAVFNTMMIPERLGTAAMTIGAARPALDIATAYTTRRKAFGRTIDQFQGVSFQVAEAATLLDAARALVYATARAVDAGVDPQRIRRMVSETKKFTTESCQKAAHHAMQVMGGIGYTTVFPVERIVRDLRLASIWTGTNEIMSAIIAGEWYREHRNRKGPVRNYEADAQEAFAAEEKISESRRDALLAADDDEFGLPGGAGEGHVERPAHFGGERGRPRHADHDRQPRAGGFLDHLVADARGQDQDDGLGELPGDKGLADGLVERVVPPDVLGEGDHLQAAVDQHGRMRAPGPAMDDLVFGELIDAFQDLVDRNPKGSSMGVTI
jgi:hypothetical protein